MVAEIYQFKIKLRPPQSVTQKRVFVSSNASLLRLHRILQTVMGWHNKQQHQFIVQGRYYGMPSSENLYEMFDETQTKVKDVVSHPGDSFRYLYDFNENLTIDLTLERKISRQQSERRSLLTRLIGQR